MKNMFTFLLFALPLVASAQMEVQPMAALQNELDSIKVSEITTGCDCSDGMAKVSEILVRETNSFSSRSEVMEDDFAKQVVTLTSKKTNEISAFCTTLGINDIDIFDCPSFKTLELNANILNEKFGY